MTKQSTPKQGNSQAAAKARKAIFVDAYIANGGNATEAAKTAGYSVKTAYSQGGRLMKNVDILRSITERAQKVAEKIGLTTERTLMEVARIAYSDPRKFYKADGTLKPIHELDDDTAAAIASLEVEELSADGKAIGYTKKLKQWDKNAALEKAMKFHGLYEKDNEQLKPVVIVMSKEDADL